MHCKVCASVQPWPTAAELQSMCASSTSADSSAIHWETVPSTHCSLQVAHQHAIHHYPPAQRICSAQSLGCTPTHCHTVVQPCAPNTPHQRSYKQLYSILSIVLNMHCTASYQCVSGHHWPPEPASLNAPEEELLLGLLVGGVKHHQATQLRHGLDLKHTCRTWQGARQHTGGRQCRLLLQRVLARSSITRAPSCVMASI
jgi:hypothetical protein